MSLGKITIEAECRECKNKEEVEITEEQLDKLESGKGYIQDILNDTSPDKREIFISGMCSSCWDRIFIEG